MLTAVVTFQRTLYNPDFSDPAQASTMPDHSQSWYLAHLGVHLVVATVLLYGALVLFSRLEDNFAEEI
jgi:hypothetical protein